MRDHSVRLADAGMATLLPMLIVGLLAWRHGAGCACRHRRRRGRLGGAQCGRLRQWILAECGAADDRRRAASARLRRRAAMARPAAGASFRQPEHIAAACAGARPRPVAGGESRLPVGAGAPGRGDRVHRHLRLHRAQRTAGPKCRSRVAERLLQAGRRGGDGVRRRHHQLHRRRRDGAVRAAAIGARRRLQCRSLLRRAQPPDDGVAGRPAGVDQVADRLQDSARISAPSWHRGSAARTSRSPPRAIPSMWQAG